MFTQLSLRLRVFLFFLLIAAGGLAALVAGLWLGHARVQDTSVLDGFVFAGVVAGLVFLGLTAGVWLLFDENVAKPIERLAATLRARAHAGTESALDTQAARYLGDLAPAAEAVSSKLGDRAMRSADDLAQDTARLAAEKERLTALLTEIPVAMILVGSAGRIVLYDGQAAEVLAQIGMPRLNALVTEYFDAQGLESAVKRMRTQDKEVSFDLRAVTGTQSFSARARPLKDGGYMLTIDDAQSTIAPEAARPLVYDFSLLDRIEAPELADTPLRDLCFAVFDTETTGLLPHKDDVVQLGAVRVLSGQIIPGEQIDALVDPGRPIPPASTKVHGISDAMVAGQPDFITVGRQFHAFARDAVLVAHNAPFDLAFLRRQAEKMGVTWDHPVFDTVLLSAVLFGASTTHTLDALCKRLDITIPENLRHTALGDARATAEVLVRMLPMLEARGFDTFGKVIAQTKRHGRLLEDLN